MLLFVAMGICLAALGYGIGLAFFGQDGPLYGILSALIVWSFLSMLGFFSGDQILLSVSHAREVSSNVHPQLFNVVEEMKIAANLKAMPKIYIIDEPAPNAFATGRKSEKSAVAVTTGLLAKLNRDELQGVIAHEMSHILNRDILFMTFAGILLGSIVLISDVFIRGGRYSTGSARRFRASRSGDGQGQAALLVIALVFAILAPILARLLYFAISRSREYLADASGVRLTRYPEGLARALEKISASGLRLESANQVTAPMYIVNPLRDQAAHFMGLVSTHPPIEKRVQILRKMMHADFKNYQSAYSSVTGKSSLLPASALTNEESILIRKPVAEPSVESISPRASIKETAREVGDLNRAVQNYAFLACTCGLKIKVPPDYQKPNIVCSKCWQALANPFVKNSEGAALQYKAARQNEGFVYERKSRGWESFACACGKLIQLSPQFQGRWVTCHQCHRNTEIKNQPVLSSH